MSKNIKFQAISATLWSIARIGFDQFFSFLVFVVIARLLGPMEIGLFALGMIFSELARIFSTSGFSDAVTKADPEEEEETSRAAFWGNMAVGVLCAIVMTVLSGPIAYLMNAPRLNEILIALAWTIPLSAGGAIHMARQLRRFGHKTLAIRSLISGVIGGTVAIIAAFYGFGVWSLVIQRVITEGVSMVTAWMAFRWWPSPNFSRKSLMSILPFSIQISASKLLGVIVSRIQDVVIGVFIGPSAVGIYRIARRTIDMLMTLTLTPLSTVAVNFFVAVRDDKQRFKTAYLRLMTVASASTFPAFFGIAAVAGDLVPIIYGSKWNASIFILQLLSPLSVPLVISLFTLPVLTVYGQARQVTKMTILQFVISVLLALSAAPFGMEAVVIALLVRTYVMIPYQIRLIERYTDCNIRQLIMAIMPPLAASLMMAVACYATITYGLAMIATPAGRLAIVVPLGGIIYCVILLMIDRQSVKWAVEILRSVLRRKLPEIS